MFKKGSTGSAVQDIQELLSIATSSAMMLDGVFGPGTEKAVIEFQKTYGLTPDGIVGPNTMKQLNKFKPLEKFAVFVDAGHGDYANGINYTAPSTGKIYHHPGTPGHDGKGWFYEGHENRIAANDFANQIRNLGFVAVKTYDTHKDTPLNTRTAIVRSWVNRGWIGYLHSFHSNAIDTKNSKEKLEATRGALCYTTIGQNDSDKIAQKHFDNLRDEFGKEWVYRSDKSDGDSDYEANFAIIRDTDKFPNRFAAFLEEFGFFTSSIDTQFIMRPDIRKCRVECALKTYRFAKDLLTKTSPGGSKRKKSV